MNAPVQQHAAALRLHMPPVAGNAIGSVHSRFKLEQRSDCPVVVHFLDDPEVFIPPPVLMNHQHTSGSLGRLSHFNELIRGHRDRLLADHMLASSERSKSNLLVHIVRRCNQYGPNLRICQNIFIAGIGGIPRRLGSTASFLKQVECSGHLQTAVLLNQLCVIASHSAITNDDDRMLV
ncbi:hypothetical protein D3C73_626020 [compost metagenome]